MNKRFLAIMSVLVFGALVIALTPLKAPGASITNIWSNVVGTTTNIGTNVWFVSGNSQTQLTVQTQSILSNLATGVITTNTDTTVVANIPYYPDGMGWVYGNTNGQISFMGTAPVPQQFFTNYPAAQVSTEVSNLAAILRLIGLTRTN